MKIGPVEGGEHQPDKGEKVKRDSKENPKQQQDKSDSLKISDEARRLQKTEGADSERIREIKNRVERGFYKRPNITEKIADKLAGDDIIEIDYLKAKEPELFEGIDDSDEEPIEPAESDRDDEG